jgi:folate-binding protein YgfZ
LARRTPLFELHAQGDALLSSYGNSPSGDPVAALVEAFDPVEIEYASIRSHAAIFDQPHRATLAVTGPDRLEFLNRMVTQELKGFEAFSACGSFWLNRKGRIDGDLRLLNLPDRVLIDVDVHAVERTLTGLSSFIIIEDCRVEDQSERWHRMSMHGPAAAALAARCSVPIAGNAVAEIRPGQASIVRIGGEGGAEVVVDRRDICGEIGLEMLVPVERAAEAYEAISTPWSARQGRQVTPSGELARRIGWHALNIARIENGTALYLADFGPDSLPHETGQATLHDRVSFKKGCYLGQEVVARMNALGHPKQRLVGLRIEAPTGEAKPMAMGLPDLPQAVTGTAVVASDEPTAAVVGAVTSSCFAPMLGQTHIAFAMVKWSHAQEGTKVWVQLDNRRLAATVRESLAFWKR